MTLTTSTGAAPPDAVALYAAHRLGLTRLAVLLVDDLQSAEDVVQDAFAGFLGRAGRLDDPDKALAYLRRSVVNGARSALRHRKVVEKHAPRPAPDGASAEHGALLAVEHAEVMAALRLLPERQREVLVLRYYLDLSEAGIADALGISRGAVKSHASRGIATLRRTLEASA
jgi:RNA polymerase sigma-70 factor (sigma-E family)